MEKNSGPVVPEGLVTARFSGDGLPVFYYPGERPLLLPENIPVEALIKVEWPGRDRGFALFRVKKPPEGNTGVFIHALESEEAERVIESGQDLLAYEIKIAEGAKKPV